MKSKEKDNDMKLLSKRKSSDTSMKDSKNGV